MIFKKSFFDLAQRHYFRNIFRNFSTVGGNDHNGISVLIPSLKIIDEFRSLP